MHCLRVGVAALNQTPLDWQGNRSRIERAIQEAREQDTAILCLPELAITGYGCEDAFMGCGVGERAMAELLALAPLSVGMTVIVGLPLRWRGATYNAAAVLVDGRVEALIGKQHLAGEGLHYEPRWFSPWPQGVQVTYRHHDGSNEWSCPLGDAYLDIGGIRLGLEICEDAWVARRPSDRLAERAIDLIANPSASHFAFAKHRIRQQIISEGSRATGACYLYSNLLGNDAGRIIYDGSTAIAARGSIVASGERLGLGDVYLTTAIVDIDANRRAFNSRSDSPNRVQDDDLCIPVPFRHQVSEPASMMAPDPGTGWESSQSLKEEEFTRALTLGLTDYIRKSRSRGAIISLSGGADSAAVACAMRLTWDRGISAYGENGWRQRIGMPEETSFADWCICVYQATANSGDTTRNAARELAHGLGATYHLMDVEDLAQSYTDKVGTMMGRQLNWDEDDIALQNIQARVRAPGVWMLANCLGMLLLSTSNRSEAAVGYATMDGDTCGGLSPIAGIDKAFLRSWLHWLETSGPHDMEPLPSLAAINAQVPTAELRPQDAGQTDEDDLMPYPVLDRIERLAIRDKYPPADCLRQLAADFPGYERPVLVGWIKRFFTLWCRNQWKRERYAPSFHVDDANLDPKTWCRFPILSGGFQTELAELDESEG